MLDTCCTFVLFILAAVHLVQAVNPPYVKEAEPVMLQ